MTEDTSTAATPPLNTGMRIAWGALIVVTLAVCYFSSLGAIGFVGPDEPRYAWIARDMAETGDWITPRLYGKPWFEKPVLYYWMAGACFKLFGVSEITARLPSALCALFATLALAWLAWRTYGAETARWLLLLLPTSVGMIGFSHAAATDMPFSGMLTIAMVFAAIVLGLTRSENTPVLPRTPWLALTLFGVFLGLAVLAKGPAAIILSGGAVFFWAIFTKRWRDAFRLLHPIAIVAFCVTALPWYILCARRNPDFFRVFIIEHNFKRYLTPEFQHIQPFWYYLPVLLIELLPWAFVALGALVGRCIEKPRFRLGDQTLFLTTWSSFGIVFFTVSKSKLPGYILPALPAVVFLMAIACSAKNRVAIRGSMIGGLLAGIGFGAVGMLPVLTRARHDSLVILPVIGAVFGALAFANLAIAATHIQRFSQSVRTTMQLVSVVPLLILFAGVAKTVNHHWFWAHSPRSVAAALIEENVSSSRLSTFRLKRDAQYALNFYLHSEIPDLQSSERREWLVVTQAGSCERLIGEWNCDAVWDHRDLGDSIWWLLRVTPKQLPPSPAGSGQPH